MKKIILTIALMFFYPLISWGEVFPITNPSMDFSSWKVKEFKGKASYKVEEHSKRLIRLYSEGTSFSLSKDFVLDISEYPYINFEWMVQELPKDSDVRFKDKDDQAAQIYVTVPSFPEMVNFKSIGYVWDSTAPLGEYQSKKVSNIKYVVLRSGSKDLAKLLVEKRNVYEDFKRLWGINLKKRKVVITIAIDSDDTKSKAISYFGDIYFSKE